jgi:hypothetical protein
VSARKLVLRRTSAGRRCERHRRSQSLKRTQQWFVCWRGTKSSDGTLYKGGGSFGKKGGCQDGGTQGGTKEFNALFGFRASTIEEEEGLF